MLLFSESRISNSPLGRTSIEYGSIPSLLPSNTVSTVYPFSNFTIDLVAIAVFNKKPIKKNISLGQKQTVKVKTLWSDKGEKNELVLVEVDLSDHSHFMSEEPWFEMNPLTISASKKGWDSKAASKDGNLNRYLLAGELAEGAEATNPEHRRMRVPTTRISLPIDFDSRRRKNSTSYTESSGDNARVWK